MDTSGSDSSEEKDIALDSDKRDSSEMLGTILRSAGVILVLVAIFFFLFQGWTTMESLDRFYRFIVFSSTLLIFSFVLKYLLRDDASGLALSFLAAVSMSAHFSQLGAFIYSLQGKLPDNFNSSFILKANSIESLLIPTILTMTLSVVSFYFAFLLLRRERVLKYFSLALSSHVLLLIPLRDSLSILIIAFVPIIGFFALTYFRPMRSEQKSRWEIEASTCILFLPLLIQLGRAFLHLYVNLAFALTFLGVALFARPVASSNDDKVNGRRTFSNFCFFLSWTFILNILESDMKLIYFSDVRVLFNLIPFSIIMYLSSLKNENKSNKIRDEAALLFSAAFVLQLVYQESTYVGILGLISSILIFVAASNYKDNNTQTIAVLGFIIHLGYLLNEFWHLIHLNPWMIFGGVGLGLILLSSYFTNKSKNKKLD